jgi:hypothetical protein
MIKKVTSHQRAYHYSLIIDSGVYNSTANHAIDRKCDTSD